MSFDYDRTASTALRLLTRFGQPMTLRRVTDGAYSAGAVTQTAADTKVVGIVDSYSDYESRNELIEANDRKVTLAAKGVVLPTVADQLITLTATFKIIAVKALNPAGTAVIYELQVRQ